MSLLKKKSEKIYTWQDYLTWPDDERWEVIDGKAYDMSPSPSSSHQRFVLNFATILKSKLTGGKCKVFIAPLDVYLDDYNFVQPDVMVVCDEKKIKDRIYGAPDLIIEVLSPSTSLKDKRDKKALYEKFKVREYIVVEPEGMVVEKNCLISGKYKGPFILGSQEVLRLASLDKIEVPLWEVFEVSPPAEESEQ
ncbi:MAG: Uma2 family endonuclease [Nitrospirae bacterium]|nr:Uma2 family endonuclease [Nitrospirota bacterium]